MAARTDLRFDVAALDRASQVFTRMGKAVESFERRLERLDGQKVAVDVEARTEKADRAVGAFATDMQRRIAKAIAALPDIELDADADQAHRSIAGIRASLVDLAQQRIGVDIDADDAAARVRLLQAELDTLGEHADIQIRTDASQAAAALGKIRDDIGGLDREVGQFARDLQRDITRAVESLPDIELDADADPAHREVARIRGELAALADQRIGIDLDATEAHARAQSLERELRLLGDLALDVQLDADVTTALAQLAAVRGEVDKLDGRTARVTVDVDRGLADTIVRVAALGRALGTLAIPAGLAASVPTIAQLGAALVTATGALGVLPAAGAAALAAVTALTVGMHGLADAFDEDPKKAAEAMARLAPAARDTVTAVRGFATAWRDLQLDVQGRLFDGLATRVQALGRTYLPIVRGELGNVASSFSRTGQAVGDMLARTDRVADLRVIFGQAAGAVDDVLQAVTPLGGALVDIGAVGSGVLRDITDGARDAAVEFAAFISNARQSGDLARWMREGVEQVRQLGRIARDTGGILLDVFRAAEEAGGGVLDTVERLVTATRDWTSSANGQATLVSFFRSIREAVDAAAPGVRTLVDAISGVIQRLGDAGVLRTAGEAFSAIAAEVAPLIDQLGNLAPLVSGLLGVVRDLAPVLIPAAAALAGFWAAAKLMSGISTVTTAVGGFFTTLRGIGQIDDATGKVRTLAGALGAGGILGLALAAAGVALSIYAGAQADAAQAAADHKARVDELKGTLDQYSGAATAATKAQVAQELGTKKLADGTTSYASALSAAGVSLADYTDAASGNEAALGKVRGQLDRHVAGLIAASPAYKTGAADLDRMGISLADVAAAAQGNAPALERIHTAVGTLGGPISEAGSSFQQLITALFQSAEGSSELGAELNTMAGQFGEAQQQARDAATATRDFGTTLDGIKAGFAGLAGGAEQTDLMRAGLVDLATAARDAAKASGDNAAALGGTAAGAKAAADSMQQSRDAFISAAQGAGLSADQAARLADQIGLIPATARTVFETNAAGVTAELLGVKGALDAVPGAKEIVVQTLTDEAKAALEDLGFRVERLKDGTVKITPDTAEARAEFDAFVATINTTAAAPKLDLDTATATQKADGVKAYIDGLVGIATADANAAPGTEKADGLKTHIDGITGILAIDGNPAPGTQKAADLQAHVNGLVGIMTQDANNAPGTAKGDALRAYIDGLLGIMEAQADTAPGTQQGRDLKAYIDRLRAAITVSSNASAVNRDIDTAARPRNTQIRVSYFVTNRLPATGGGTRPIQMEEQGGILQPMADGGVVKFARGGGATTRKLRPMSPLAQVVAPNTWRVVGDRMRGSESYIPIVRSSRRSHTILDETAHRMGRTILPLAAGGLVGAAGDRIRAVMQTFQQPTAAAGGFGSGAELRAMLGQLRALRGDVDQGGYFAQLIDAVNGLRRDLTRGGSSYADVARDAALLGGSAWR